MSEDISLYELLNLSIRTAQGGAVNFGALHALLHAVLRQLDVREVKTRWRDPPPGEQQEVQAGTELSPPPSSGPAAEQRRLRSRIQTCEEDMSEVMKLIQELHDQKDKLKEEIKELRHQQKMVGAQTETVTAVEKCCHRVEALEETVRSLRDTFQQYPDPEELSQCVTWDAMQSALLSEKESLQKELINSGVFDPATVIQPTYTPFNSNFTAPSHTSAPSSPCRAEDTGRPAAPGSPLISGQFSTLQEATDSQTATETPSVPRKANGSECYPETVEALTNVGKLKETFNQLEARVVALEEGKVDQSQLTHLRELITNKGSQDATNNLMDQLHQQRTLIDGLMSDREKLDSLEDALMNLTSRDRETTSEAATGSSSPELRQQLSYLRRSVQKLEEDMKQLKAKQALTEERRTEQHLQAQLDDLRGMLEDMILSLTSQLSDSLQDQAGQDESDSQGLGGPSIESSAFASSTVKRSGKLGRLFQHCEQLQDTVSSLLQQHTGGRAGPLKDIENVELVNNVQKVILQLQAEFEKLHETTRCLHDDNRQKQSHIEDLYKTTEELEEKKADKQMVESEIKADKSALESKVSRLQFDSVTEQLNAMFHELLNKVTGQEQDWHKVIDKLSTEMECKLNRIELDSVKKQLEGRWKNIHEKLQAQGAPEHEDAAGLRKQLVDRFHCLSCDRPVVKYTPGPHSVKLPSTPGFPAHKSIRPFTVFALEQFRQHYRRREAADTRILCPHASMFLSDQTWGERVSEPTDHSHPTVSRSCGGSHTVTSASQRRTGLQTVKHHTQTEVDGTIQSEEVDIVGLDGHIYKGRLNAAAIRNTETKLPTISTKDGICKTKDKAKCSLSHKPAASPEGGHAAPLLQPHSAKSAQCSRSASSSGRDWPVSTLGCASQSSITQAESSTEPQTDEPVNL